MDKTIKILMGLILVVIVAIGVFGILPQAGIGNPLGSFFESGKNSAASAALDLSGIKEKAQTALEESRDKIAAATGMSEESVDAAIEDLDIASWEVTTLPSGVTETGSADVTYKGTDATITTYDDPSVVTVTAMGQDVTLAVPESARGYVGYLEYL